MTPNFIIYPLYFFNSIIFILGVLLFSYYSNSEIHNKTLVELNCGQTYFLSFISLTNSIICLFLLNKITSIGFLTTSLLYSYKIYNIHNISKQCVLNGNMVWFYYLYCIICNTINIFFYILAFIEYLRLKKRNSIHIETNVYNQI
jgi:hypothetical protein